MLHAGLPETTHLVHKSNHAVNLTSLRLSKQRKQISTNQS